MKKCLQIGIVNRLLFYLGVIFVLANLSACSTLYDTIIDPFVGSDEQNTTQEAGEENKDDFSTNLTVQQTQVSPLFVSDENCPKVRNLPTTLYQSFLPNRQSGEEELVYQSSISQSARECSLNAGAITAKIGIAGRSTLGALGKNDKAYAAPLRIVVRDKQTREVLVDESKPVSFVVRKPSTSVIWTEVRTGITYPADRAVEIKVGFGNPQ